jgi:hypothetical protein
VRAALEASLNLTLLNEEKVGGSLIFLTQGGLPWLMSSLQNSFKHQDYQAVLFGLKTLAMLMKFKDPIVKVVM